MVNFLHRMRVWLFPPVSRRKAVEIVVQKEGIPASDAFPVFGKMPTSVHIYAPPKEPCWFIHVPWNDGRPQMIRSSRIILVSKISGKVLYDGGAGDEG